MLPALSITCRLALREPAAVGANVTEMEQVDPAARVAPQVVVSEKSPAFVPPMTICEMLSGPVPLLLLTVTVCAAVVVPMPVVAKVRLAGVTLAAGTPTPVPLSATVCVVPLPALSVTVSVALRLPMAAGVNVTEMVQLPPMATEPAQLLLVANDDALVPLMAMLPMVSAAVPELLSVVVSAPLVLLTFWLPKASELGETAAAATPTPVPVSATVWVVDALSVIVNVAVLLPAAVGVNVTAMLQLAPTATDDPQLFVVAKLLALVPLRAMLVMLSALEPVLVSVAVCELLVEPTFWLPNPMLVGETLALATPAAVPVKDTVWLEAVLLALSLMVSVAVRVPAAVGENVTEMLQFPPIATLPAQVLVVA